MKIFRRNGKKTIQQGPGVALIATTSAGRYTIGSGRTAADVVPSVGVLEVRSSTKGTHTTQLFRKSAISS